MQMITKMKSQMKKDLSEYTLTLSEEWMVTEKLAHTEVRTLQAMLFISDKSNFGSDQSISSIGFFGHESYPADFILDFGNFLFDLPDQLLNALIKKYENDAMSGLIEFYNRY